MSGVEHMGISGRSCHDCDYSRTVDEREMADLASQINSDWVIHDSHHLRREWSFPDFASALIFVNQAGDVCEAENHHADFELGWGRVCATIWTHSLDGLTEAEFVLAAKMDALE